MDPVRAEAIAKQGALGPSQLAAVEQRLKGIGRRLVEMATQKEKIPQSQSLNEVIMPPASPLFVSFATKAYLPALQIAIQSVEALRKQSGDSGIQMRVYLGADVSSADLSSWVQIRRLPEPPAAFPDMYEPKMFGWKLQILHDLCHEEELTGIPVLYADAGAMWITMPQDMLTTIHESGVCLVKDRNQINRHWCSEPMVKAMGVSLEELEQNQLMASVIGFKAGSVAAQQLFDEALKWGSQKEVLFGPYLNGLGPDGHLIGHRHDQSILSILAGRYACPLVEGMRTVCEVSLRKAHQKSNPVYLHRGQFTHHKQVIPGIDDVWGISLDRRPDRWQSLLEAHPDLVPILNRLPGIDGRLLNLTPDLTNLFAKNDFKWKKSVTGCALSHILTWAQLASEHPLVQNYLILEDDCRFVDAEWTDRLAHVVAKAPLDADLLMLGGVLPSNLHLYQDQLESVNDTWATLKPNDLFSPGAVIPFFHFCAYSYVLTKTGAKKLLASLQTKGVYTSIDHYLMHPLQGLKTYVLKDLMTTCFQADNPVYKAAAFDEFLRVDTYDSDIWNNKECFLNPIVTGEPIHLWNSLIDVLQQAPHSIQTRNTLRPEALLQTNLSTVYYLSQQGKKTDGTMEEEWLKSLWPQIQYLPFPSVETLPPNSWLLVARPHLSTWTSICQALHEKGTPFRVLHLSDENCSDPIDFYRLPSCKKVIRNYRRLGLDEKVLTLPLGSAVPVTPSTESIPSFSKRPFVWGFHGTNWFNREALLKPLQSFTPHLVHWTPNFKHKTMTGPKEYQQMLLKSQFAPVPRGNNAETFRLYEALDQGAIPLYIRTEGDEVYWSWLRGHLNLLELISWDQVPKVLELFRKFPEKGESYRTGLLNQWATWKAECKTYFP